MEKGSRRWPHFQSILLVQSSGRHGMGDPTRDLTGKEKPCPSSGRNSKMVCHGRIVSRAPSGAVEGDVDHKAVGICGRFVVSLDFGGVVSFYTRVGSE